jgi:hypoxanthine phosphoribosyltransferase
MKEAQESFSVRHRHAEIRARVVAIARTVEARVGSNELLVVGVLKGSAIFLADLVRELRVPVRFEFIDVERQDQADAAGEPHIAIRFFRHFPVSGRYVLILKDIVTTGVVETYLLSQLRSQGAADLVLACVVDRPPARRVALDVDLALFRENEDARWVGYGLDAGDGRCAHFPDLGVLMD